MPQEYSWEERQQACDLYIMGGFTFKQVAQITGVSESQLKRWSAEEEEWAKKRGEDPKDWPGLRKEFRLAQSSAPRQKVLLRALLIGNAVASKGDFKQVLAAAMWEKAQGRGGEPLAGLPPVSPAAPAPEEAQAGLTPALQIKTPQDAVAVLQEAVNQKVQWVANNPGQLTSETITDLNKVLALMEKLTAKYRPAEGKGEAPEEDGAARRRLVAEVNQILGVR